MSIGDGYAATTMHHEIARPGTRDQQLLACCILHPFSILDYILKKHESSCEFEDFVEAHIFQAAYEVGHFDREVGHFDRACC